MNSSPVVETISLVAFVASLFVGVMGDGTFYETAGALLFIAAGLLFTHEIWWNPKRRIRRSVTSASVAS